MRLGGDGWKHMVRIVLGARRHENGDRNKCGEV
jgi:hypothetical protein